MTDQTRLIAVPKDSAVLARGIGEAHRRYRRMKNFAEGVGGYLFQGRFGSCVVDDNRLLAAARYIELNPVHVWARAGNANRSLTGNFKVVVQSTVASSRSNASKNSNEGRRR